MERQDNKKNKKIQNWKNKKNNNEKIHNLKLINKPLLLFLFLPQKLGT